MNRKWLYLLFILSLLYNGCYLITQEPDVMIKKEFIGNDIAVLNFSTQGSFMVPNAGKLAADKLTDALFLIGKFNVIDRSKVNQAQGSLDLRNTDFLSADEIQKIGLSLRANYLVVGSLREISDSEYMSMNEDKNIYISFRIISVTNSDVVGMATYSDNFDDNAVEKIQEMMNDIVTKMVD